jgi:hypothetical protein
MGTPGFGNHCHGSGIHCPLRSLDGTTFIQIRQAKHRIKNQDDELRNCWGGVAPQNAQGL